MAGETQIRAKYAIRNPALSALILSFVEVVEGMIYAIRDTNDKRRATINMQNKPNLLDAQMNVSSIITREYENFIPLAGQKNKPNPSGLRCLRRSPSMRRRMTHCRTDQTQFLYQELH